jgi:chromosome segregation ATPase
MNPKRWFAWVCLALMLAAEVLLYRANHERDAAQTDLRAAQQQLRQAQADLDDLKNSSAGAQVNAIAGLRKQNELLNGRLDALQKTLDQFLAASNQMAQKLTTARTALQLQQEHLHQLQSEKQQIVVASAAVMEQNACINNLRLIDAAKTQWALEKNKADKDVPTAQDLLPYLKDGVFPVCPSGGVYTINAVGEIPACSISGHVLPP